jgi:cell volume regulation protein A
MFELETLFLTLSTLIIISILISRLSNNIGVPVLLLFLAIGMLAGSEGPGGIYFNDPQLAQNIGITSLVLILFSGGLGSEWKHVKPVLWPAVSLSTLGVLVTTTAVGCFTTWLFDLPWHISLLLGAIVASTDAAAVFSIIGARNIKIKGNITPLLELESGSNDPMAVFLTITLLEITTAKESSYLAMAGDFLLEMGIGLALGLLLGKAIVFLINRLKFPIEGLYPVFVFASAFFVYALTAMVHGSGFLAVYVAGMMVGSANIVHKKNIFRFFDGTAWVSQILMFITLGLLVFPSHILPAIKTEFLISLFLIFIARPLGVFVSLIPFQYTIKEKAFISWVGLRGAVPIILATFPMIAGIPEAQWIFNVVFFIVLTSALFQGWSIPWVANLLKLNAPPSKLITMPSEFNNLDQTNRTLIKLTVPDSDLFCYKPLVEVKALKGSLIISVKRETNYFVPSGGSTLEPGDEIQALVDDDKIDELVAVVNQQLSAH